MLRSIRHAARSGALVALAAAGLTRVAAGEEGAPPRLVIRFYDSTHAKRESLDAAGGEAARILHRAGVMAAWIDCDSREAAESICRRPAGLLDVVFKIVRRPESRRAVADDALGFSVVPDDGSSGVLAGAFLDRVRLVAPTEAWAFRVVGLVAAHEVGHLLLGRQSHSGAGIMRADLLDRNLAGAAWGQLVFSPDEAKRMREELQRRSTAAD